MSQITVRVDQAVIDYREEACSRGIKKKFFDQRVYTYFMQHHPDPFKLTIEDVAPEMTEQDPTS